MYFLNSLLKVQRKKYGVKIKSKFEKVDLKCHFAESFSN